VGQVVLDTPSPLIVVPSRLIDPFVWVYFLHSHYYCLLCLWRIQCRCSCGTRLVRCISVMPLPF